MVDHDRPNTGTEAMVAEFEKVLPGQAVLARSLLARYDEPQRHYHDREHLAHVLASIDQFSVASSDLFSVRLAAWFHDAVYLVQHAQVSNEEASARLANRELGLLGFEQEELNEVTRLVRLTETHRPGPNDRSGDLLCDADLAVLGSSPEEYARYRDRVRAEYPHVDDADFAAGRLAVLQSFGGRTIFRTTAGRALNRAAQRNLHDEATELINAFGLQVDGWPETEEDHRS